MDLKHIKLDIFEWSYDKSYDAYYDVTSHKLIFEYPTHWGCIKGELVEAWDETNSVTEETKFEFDYVEAFCTENEDGYSFISDIWISDDDDNPPSNTEEIETFYNQFINDLETITQEDMINLIKLKAPRWWDYIKQEEKEAIERKKQQKREKIKQEKISKLKFPTIVKNHHVPLILTRNEESRFNKQNRKLIQQLLERSYWYSVERVLVQFERNFPFWTKKKTHKLIKHRQNHIEAITLSLAQYGWLGRPLIKGHDDNLLTGAHRLAALKIAVKKHNLSKDMLVPIYDLYEDDDWIFNQLLPSEKSDCKMIDNFQLFVKYLSRHTEFVGFCLGLDL